MTRAIALGLAAAFLCVSAQAVDFSNKSYCSSTHTVFASGFQRFASLKNGDGRVSTDFNPTAGAIGYVYSPGMWHAGAAFSWESGTRRYSGRNGITNNYRVESDMPGISIFGGIDTPNGWYVDADAFMGFGDYKSRRIAAANNGRGSSEHNTVFAGGLEGGKNFDLGWFFLTPHAGLDVAYTPSEHYNYTGGSYANKSQTYVEIPLGVSFSKVFDCGAWQIIPKVDVTMVNSIGHMDAMNSSPGFAYRTADKWKVAGIGGDHFGARLSAGVAAKMNDRTTLGLDYTYEGRDSYNDHRISASVGWSF